MPARSADLREAAGAALGCLGVGPHDSVLILCNRAQRTIADALARAAEHRAETIRVLEYTDATRHGQEPPDSIRDAMRKATVILAATSFSISHTQARLDATARGARIATLPAISEDLFRRGLPVDYAELRRIGERVAAALTAAATCRVTSPSGTDLVLTLEGRSAIVDDGNLCAPGAFGNLPAGEVYIAPIEAHAEGSIVFDGSLSGYGLLPEPLHITVAEGRAIAATGRAAGWLLETLDAGGPGGRQIAELGIGTNPLARLSGNTLEDEKVAGTAHLAFGTNASFGGHTVSTVHIDGILLHPTLALDTHSILRDGSLVV
jgi:leucyl aminopeptidase (aminopeptidase T)